MINIYLSIIANGEFEQAENALRLLYIDYGKRLIAIANKVLHDYQRSEEVLNDIMFKIWEKANFLSKLENPLAYISTMTYNKAIDTKRRLKEIPLEDVSLLLDNEETSDSKIDIALSMLSDKERTLVLLKDAYEYTFGEVAKTLGISYKQARNRYLKAFDNFKEIYNKLKN